MNTDPLKYIAGLTANTSTKLVQNAFDENFLSEPRLLEFLRNLTPEDYNNGLRVRVYLDGKHAPEQSYILVNSPPLPDDTFTTWGERLFGEREFLVAINNCEFSLNRLVETLYTSYARHLPESITEDVLFKGLDVVLLFGRYENSPFKLHNDPNRLSIAHFQLVGEKKLSFYHKLTDPEPYSTYTLAPGDAFTFGAHNFHLGHARNISVSLTVGLARFSFTEIYLGLSSLVINDINLDQQNYFKGTTYPTSAQFYESLERLPPLSLSQVFLDATKEQQHQMKSNLLFVGPGKFFPGKGVPKGKKAVRLRSPNKIYHWERDGIHKVFIRKWSHNFQRSERFLQLIEKLNNFEEVPIQELLIDVNFMNLLCGLDVCDFTS